MKESTNAAASIIFTSKNESIQRRIVFRKILIRPFPGLFLRFLNPFRFRQQNVKQNIFHCLCLAGRTGPLILCPGFFKMRPYVDAPVIGHVVCVCVKPSKDFILHVVSVHFLFSLHVTNI